MTTIANTVRKGTDMREEDQVLREIELIEEIITQILSLKFS
jgi:hypothetical protein